MKDTLIIALAAFFARTRGSIELTDAEMDAARADMASGAVVVLTTTANVGKDGAQATYRLELRREM